MASFVALALVGASVLLLARTWGSTTPIPAEQPPDSAPVSLGSLAYGVDGDIYVADWDGSNAVRIADGRPANECGGVLGEYWGEGPMWSPDGRYLAYRHANCPDDYRASVVISDPEGNVIAEFAADGWDIGWSPDSTRVAVWVDLPGGTIGIYGLDGERQGLLTVPPGMRSAGDYDPAWLPHGRSLFVPDVVVPIDGSTPYRADRGPAGGTYSPDGSRIAYVTRRSLVVADADGSNPQEVFGEWVESPAWSPTGDQIAFTSQGVRSRWAVRPNELQVLDVASGTVRLLAEMDRSEALEVIDFSPEGDRILFSRADALGVPVGSLWSINADGSDPHRLVAGTAWGDWHSLSQTR